MFFVVGWFARSVCNFRRFVINFFKQRGTGLTYVLLLVSVCVCSSAGTLLSSLHDVYNVHRLL